MALALFALAPISILSHIGPEEGPLYYHGMASRCGPGSTSGGIPSPPGGRPRPDHPAGLRAARCGRLGLGAPVCGFLCSWLQPWQGATLVAIVLGTEVLLRRREHSASPLLTTVTVTATALPLGYYAALSRFDSGWALAGEANRGPWPWWAMPLFFVPIVVVVSWATGRPARTFQDLALRVWPVAALGVFCFILYTPFGTYQPMPYSGLGIPVAVLAVRGVTSLGATWKGRSCLRYSRGCCLRASAGPRARAAVLRRQRGAQPRSYICPCPTFSRTANRTPSTTWRRTPVEWGSLPAVPGADRARPHRSAHLGGHRLLDPGLPPSRRACQRSLAAGWGRWGRNGWYGGRATRFLLSDCRTGSISDPCSGRSCSRWRFGCAAIYRVR